MDKNIIYKILLIEPSSIVSYGIKALISESNQFEVSTIISNLNDYAKYEHRVYDIIMVNPLVVNYDQRSDIRSLLGAEPNTVIVSLCYNLYDENVLQHYDGNIGIFDSPKQVYRKLNDALNEIKEHRHVVSNELSARERSILTAVAKGKTNKEIADEFNLSIYTVVTHRKNISHKLGINSISGLTVYAILNKLIDVSDF